MSEWDKKSKPDSDGEAGKTAPGARALKSLWNITSAKKEEVAPAEVSSDIYSLRNRSSAIPPRPRTHRHRSRS